MAEADGVGEDEQYLDHMVEIRICEPLGQYETS